MNLNLTIKPMFWMFSTFSCGL